MIKIVIEEYIRKQFLVGICLYIGNIMVGYAVGWSSPIVIKLQDPTQTPLDELITDETASWVGSTLIIGVALGPYISGPLCNIVGRKICLLIGGGINFAAQIILVLSYNLAMVLAGRIICGIGIGIILVTNIVYVGEIASSNIRGILLTGSGVLHTFGTLIAYVVGAYVSYAVVIYVFMGIGVAHVLLTLTLPESPLYYLIKGDINAAKDSLRALGRDKDVDKEINAMSESTKKDELGSSIWTELFTMKSNRISLTICIALFVFQFVNGTVAALYFTHLIFEKAQTNIDSSLSAIIVGLTQFIGTLIVPFVIERSGRKTLTLCSFVGCCVGMVLLGTYFYLNDIDEQSTESLGWLPLTALILVVISFSIGLNITPNALTGEMFRPNVRSLGSSIGMTIGSWAGVISVTTFGYLIAFIGEAFTFWMFAIINVIGFIFTIFVVKETKGMTLAEIDHMLS